MNSLSPRPYVIEEYTRTVCPLCSAEYSRRSDEAGVWKDGMLVSHEGSIWLRRFCAEHGETESLYEEDAELWRARQGWSTPTLQITPDRATNFGAFPDAYRDGLPASHGQHTCILVLNITDRCNYGCTTCYAVAKAPGTAVPRDEAPTIEDILLTVQTILQREGGRLSVLMLSGGEPTVRDDLQQIIARLSELPITRILLNTNGRRIARDDKFLAFLHEHRDRLEIYLQFDGVRDTTYQQLRNEAVAREKLCALQRLSEAGLFTTLVMTVARGINEDEIGDVAMLGLETSRCAGLALQPMFGSGRALNFDAQSRATPTGVLKRLQEQTRGVIQSSDFIPLPCSHKDCCDITYLIKTASGTWQSIPKLIGRDELKNWIHLFGNTISFDNLSEPLTAMLKSGALARVFSEQLPIGTPQLARDLSQMCDCVPGLPQLLGGLWSVVQKRTSTRNEAQTLEKVAERTFRITVKMFMDAHTFHEARIRQCCVHTGTFEDDPRRYSFCWRWLFADATDFPSSQFEAPTATVIPLQQLTTTGINAKGQP
jgi:uncharacterized radical SAM superfamily Fe-S cluster-containing enzyme